MLNRLGKFAFLFLVAGALLIAGCAKPKKPVGTITTVKYSDQTRLPNVDITLSVPLPSDSVNPDIIQTLTTNASGQVTFEYDLPNILEIDASVVVGGATLTGSGIIKMEDDEHAQVTVELQ